ncbi:hypothetical protein ACN1C3_30495 [Pseudomonas sp. H11T01]|uniref:hypothetical protein n=1 Tax=Pseudomonas sp. H11T01 TaxID=3402749 RepID=UPI003ABF62DA
MRNRGQKYWDWADPELHSRTHDSRLSDGTLINVQVRLSKAGVTQLFFGIYDKEGTMLFEESFDSRLGETMTQAMEWGLAKARELIDLSCARDRLEEQRSQKARSPRAEQGTGSGTGIRPR